MADFHLPAAMTAPRFLGAGKIEAIEKPVPKPGPGQLLLQVRANALCGSERGQFYEGTPVTPGHEAAGVVVAVGPGTRTPAGTPGVVFLMDFCGECRSCRLGLTNQCLAKRADMGFSHDGGYGPYELVHENIFFPVDADIPLGDATLLLDIMGTNGHAIRRARLVHPDPQSMLVTGAGPIGLGMAAMARITFGPDFPVAIADIVPWRLQLAETLGALPIDLNRQPLAEGLRRHGLETVDLTMDTSGKQAARQTCLTVLAKRGVLVCIGHGEGLSLTVSPDLIANERAVLGSEYFCFDELPANLALLRSQRPYLKQIITHRYGVDEIEVAFRTFFGGETGKVVIEQ
ncbi:MAG: alcohol dehydrogenase catalytic domain-containing protein [Caldilineaceae bacterium]